MMGYYNQTGKIGEYKGKSVYIVNNEDLRLDNARSNVIYAVRKKNSSDMWLVLDGQCIGTMNNDGDIRRKPAYHWTYYHEPKEEVEVKVEKSDYPIVDTTVIDNYDYTIDLKGYSGVVDDVFRNLNKWWDDLERQ